MLVCTRYFKVFPGSSRLISLSEKMSTHCLILFASLSTVLFIFGVYIVIPPSTTSYQNGAKNRRELSSRDTVLHKVRAAANSTANLKSGGQTGQKKDRETEREWV